MARRDTQHHKRNGNSPMEVVRARLILNAKELAEKVVPPKDWYRGYLQSYAHELAENPHLYPEVWDDACKFLEELNTIVPRRQAA